MLKSLTYCGTKKHILISLNGHKSITNENQIFLINYFVNFFLFMQYKELFRYILINLFKSIFI